MPGFRNISFISTWTWIWLVRELLSNLDDFDDFIGAVTRAIG